jgi:hypothetical protein
MGATLSSATMTVLEDPVIPDGTQHDQGPPPPQPERPTIMIKLCADGDLTLHVGENLGAVHSILVSRDKLRNSSPVFDNLLGVEYAGKDTIGLKDDDPDAFLIVLKVLFGPFEEIPTKLSTATLFAVATICNTYDMVPLCRLYVDEWVENDPAEFPNRNFTHLWIYWVFGYEVEVPMLSAYICHKMKHDDHGEWIYQGYPVQRSILPGLSGM